MASKVFPYISSMRFERLKSLLLSATIAEPSAPKDAENVPNKEGNTMSSEIVDLSKTQLVLAELASVDLESLTQPQLMEYIGAIRSEWERTQKACIARANADPEVFYHKSMPQSQLFMAEIIPVIHKLYFNWPYNGTLEVLDIGPQTFSGTTLLSKTHAPDSFNNLKMKITAVDIIDSFATLRECLCPEVEFIKSDVFNIKDRTWDLVICSHVVEHVPKPQEFLAQIQKLARHDVIVACPWNENPITTKGHVNTIDKELVRKAGARELNIYTNFMWGKTREACIFTLDGKAPK